MKILFYIALLFVCASAYKSYSGYQVWRFDPRHHHVELRKLFDLMGLDVWSMKRGQMDLLIPPEKSHTIAALFRNKKIDYSTYISDVQSLIDNQHTSRKNIEPTATISFTEYHTLAEINTYLTELDVDSSLATLSSIGTSIEGRSINMVTVSAGGTGKQAIWVDCGAHAREWVSPASCLYGLDYLTTGYGVDQEVTDFLDAYDVYIVPVLNVDGYEYTWTNDRMWRKNRNPNEGGCFGVDPNRNYGEPNWGGIGAGDSPCSETYHGPAGFSDPETAAVRDALDPISSFVKAHYSVHSYSQLWMYPYGSLPELPAEVNELNAASLAAVNAIDSLYGTQYTYGNHYDAIYPASGTAIDYAYFVGIVHTYLVELRDEGQYGFILPEEQILPTAEELWAGIFANVAAIP